LIDPFDYPEQYSKEEWKKIRSRVNQKNYRDRVRGGPPVKRGGKRIGAGRKQGPPRTSKKMKILLSLTNIQISFLLEMGTGTLTSGIQSLIDKHTELK